MSHFSFRNLYNKDDGTFEKKREEKSRDTSKITETPLKPIYAEGGRRKPTMDQQESLPVLTADRTGDSTSEWLCAAFNTFVKKVPKTQTSTIISAQLSSAHIRVRNDISHN